MSHQRGKAYLVGAGVGSIAYLTLRAKEILQSAEVLLYDALVDSQLLELVPSHCLKIPVGKRGGQASTPQSKINQLLSAYCLQGQVVVRLKGGDPFIFGRSRGEIEALQESGCDFEVIPGISSALAAPLLANIPLTDKDLSSCFAVLSAHQPESLDWSALARLHTLVILMGGRNLPKIVEKLQQQGKSPDCPIAIICNGGAPQQQIWRGTLANIGDKTAGVSLSPAVIVIGEVVNLHAQIYNQETQTASQLPLEGKVVLVTRAAGQSSYFSRLLQQQGARVMEMPALAITPPSSWVDLDRAIANLATFHWLILTSSNGVNYFFNRLRELGKDARALAGIKIAVVGKKTAAALQEKAMEADFIPPNFVADSLVEKFPESLAGKKVLFPRVETGGRPILVQELTSQNAEVVEVAAYESGCPESISPQVFDALQNKQIDIITFASSKTVKNFHKLVNQGLQQSNLNVSLAELLSPVSIASIGPQTSQTCYQLLGRVDVEADEYTLEGLTRAIIMYSNSHNGEIH